MSSREKSSKPPAKRDSSAARSQRGSSLAHARGFEVEEPQSSEGAAGHDFARIAVGAPRAAVPWGSTPPVIHVLQQRSGPHLLQRKKKEGQEEGEEGPWFSVKVDRVLGPDEFMVEFIKQYRLVDEAEAREILKNENWRPANPENPEQATQADVDKGYRRVYVRDYTGAKQKRDELIRQRKAIADLPEDIRDFIFRGTGGPKLRSGDYATILRIAEKLMQLTPQERQAYLDRTTGSTTDPAAFEAAVDRYREGLVERREAGEERERTKASLLNQDDVYSQYLAYQVSKKLAGDDAPMAAQMDLLEEQAALTAALQRHGYSGIPAFEAAIEAFKAAFQAETVLIANEALDRFEHILLEQEERYSKPGETQALHKALGPARGHFQEAVRLREEHAFMPMTPEEMAYQAHWSGQFKEQQRLGFGEAAKVGESHPLLKSQGFPTEEMSLAEEGEFGGKILGYIRERLKNVRDTRDNIRDKPALVWHLDSLIAQSKRLQDIDPDSLYNRIIDNHIRDKTIAQAIIDIAIGVLALAAGLLSGGTGTIAVLGAATAFGLGSYMAYEEFRRYETAHAAYGAELLSDDPNFAWVVVAIVGAGLDLAAVGAALKNIRPAVETFNRTGDLIALEEALRPKLSKAALDNVMSAARAEAEATAAWKAARAQSRLYAAIDPIVTPLLILAVRFAYPMYLSLRRGIISFERFLLTREMVSLIGDYRKLSPEALAKVRSAYQVAMADAQRLAGHGRSLGMLDSEVERFLLLWNRQPHLSADDVARQMEQWAAPLTSRAGAKARVAPDLILDPRSRAVLPEFEHQIAGTGGIESIKAAATSEGRLAVTIEGEVLPNRLTRDPAKVSPTRRAAPSFNVSSKLFKPKEAGLSGRTWQRLHLWGPGFGDEAAAGMMWGPREVNLVWQNDSIESYIRQMSELAAMRGGRTRVKATAISWENPTPRGFNAPQGENFLKTAEYEITLIRPGQPDAHIRVTLEVAEPPGTGIRSFSIDPPDAANPADLF